MLIKLTEQQKHEVQRGLVPESAYNLKTGEELEADEFWNFEWYFVIPSEDGLIKTTCETEYPVSVQFYHLVQWWEIDVVTADFAKKILNNMFI